MFNHSHTNFVRIRGNKPFGRNNFQNDNSNLQNELTKSKVCDIFWEFCARSTIHGVGHFADRKRHWIERAWWIIAIVISSVLCAITIQDMWSKWKKFPIVVDTENRAWPIHKIPFPAITICPYAVTASDKFNYTDAYRSLHKLDGKNSRNLTAAELATLKLITQFCNEGFSPPKETGHFSDEYLNDEIWSTIDGIAPAFNETYIFCKLFNKRIDCGKLFVPRITERGLCYTFNGLNGRDMFTTKVTSYFDSLASKPPTANWNVISGYSTYTSKTYPYRAHGSDIRSSLTVIFRVLNTDLDYLCSGGQQGFTVSVHPPNENPQMYKRYFYVPLQETVLLSVQPFVMRTVRRVRVQNLNVRKCYQDSDRRLHFYKYYTAFNCKVECLRNFTLAKCGCVKYSMPRSDGTKICGPGKIECYKQTDGAAFRIDELRSCNCLPPCKVLRYNALSSQTDYHFISSDFRSDSKTKSDTRNAMYSRLIVKFKEDKVDVLRYIDAYTFADFYKKVGGVCSLFVGASLISFVELLYYGTLRLFFTYHPRH